MQIDITHRDQERLRAEVELVFSLANIPDYQDRVDYITDDINHSFQEIGEIVFYSMIGAEKRAQLDAVMYPPKPEPEPIPVAQDGEQVRYCRGCEKPTRHTINNALAKVKCVACGVSKFIVTVEGA